MPDNKKEQEREELHRAIWAIADDLRGSVDGWDFKSYILGIMFYRYISENLTNYINADEIAAGNADFDYAKLSDEEAEQAQDDLVQTKGFFILPSELFVNVRARAPQDDNLNMTMEAVLSRIRPKAPRARMTLPVCSMILMSTATSLALRWQSATRCLSSCWTASAR